MDQRKDWDTWIKNQVSETHHFTVTFSLKKYASMNGDLLRDLASSSFEIFAYCFKDYDDENPLTSNGWVQTGKRYRFVPGKTEINAKTFFSLNHTLVFVVNPDKFNMHKFFSTASVPFIVNNVSTGMVKNAWSYSRNTATRKDKLIFCKANSSPPSFTVVGGDKSISSALEIAINETSKSKT